MNRTKLGIKLTLITIFSVFILGAISLIRVKVILQNYGSELNGLMQVAVQMSAYLILIESGMTAAYQYNMYPSIKEKKVEEISRLYNGLLINMRKIGIKMLVICLIFPFVYSIFVNRIEISYLDAVSVLLVMGIRFAIPYLFIIPQTGILAAFERQYVCDLIQLVMSIVVIIIETIVIYSVKPPLYLVLMIYILCMILTIPIYTILVKKITGIEVNKDITPNMAPLDMTNDILVHQISSIVFFNTDNILLSIFKNLESVTVYSAFNTLISYPNQLINKIIGGLRSSLAIKIQGEDKNAFDVYNEILSIESFCASIVISIFVLMSNQFVVLWIGKKYALENIDVILFALIILNRMITPIVLAARDSRGLYKESKMYTVIQALTNIIISLVLIKPLGITGVLLGTVISTYFIATPFNFYLVDKKVFNKKSNVIFRYINVILVLVVVIYIEKASKKYILFGINGTWLFFVLKSFYLVVLSLIVSCFVYIFSDKYFRSFIKRIVYLKSH